MRRGLAQGSHLGIKGEQTRADIIECSARLFYQHGYDRASFSDIVAASGLHRGNIYHYFKSKDEILNAVMVRKLEDYRALLLHWEKEHLDPRARLAAFVDMITGRKAEIVEYGCPIGSINTELAKDRRELQQGARALFELFRDWLAARFRDLGKKPEADILAVHLLGRAQGIAVMAHVYQDKKLLKRETAQLHEWVRRL